MSEKSNDSKTKTMDREPIIAEFNKLRQDQRSLVQKSAELELDVNEHNLVINTLKSVDEGRKCFRMVGGVLVERNVKEVLPALIVNKEKIFKVVDALKSKVTEKGTELKEFREKHDIKVQVENDSEIKSKEDQTDIKGVLVEDSNKKS